MLMRNRDLEIQKEDGNSIEVWHAMCKGPKVEENHVYLEKEEIN